MKVKMFNLRFSEDKGGFDDAEMRRFLEDKEVRTVYQQAFTFDGRPYMAVLVKYLETGRQPAAGDGKESARPENGKSAPGNAPASKDAKPDPREGLSDRQVAEYEALRRWRFDLAQKSGVPVYQICRNNELAAVARAMPTNIEALSAIRNLRPNLRAQYGGDLVNFIRQRKAASGAGTPAARSEA